MCCVKRREATAHGQGRHDKYGARARRTLPVAGRDAFIVRMNFPLELRFKLLAISSQISVRDASGHLLCHVKQKAFKLKEEVTVFGDEAQTRPLYRINADRVIDISAQYQI